MKSILKLAELPLGQRGMIYVSRMDTNPNTFTLATLEPDYKPTIVTLKKLRSLKQTVMLWNPQSGTHRTVHTDDID